MDRATIKGQVLYKEGDAADYVFLVKEGQYEVTRMISFAEDNDARTKRIFINPMKENKVTGTAKHSNLKRALKT